MKTFALYTAALALVLAAAAPALAGTSHLVCSFRDEARIFNTLDIAYMPSKKDVVDGKGEHYESWAVTVNGVGHYLGYYSVAANALSWRGPAMRTKSALYTIGMKSLQFTIAGNLGVVRGSCKPH